MSDPVFIPVYGSAKDIRTKIQEHNLEERFTAMTPLQAIMSGGGGRLSFTDNHMDKFDDDVCFLISTEDISEEDQQDIVSLLKVDPAPVSITAANDQDEEQEILESLEDDAIGDGSELIQRYHRHMDTINRIHRSPYQEQSSAIVPLKGKIIDKMLTPGSEQSLFLLRFPTTSVSGNAGYPDVHPDTDAPVTAVFQSFRMGDIEEGRVSIDGNGHNILVTDANAMLYIETLTPCVITSLEHIGEGTHQVRSWVIHDDSIDGMTHMASRTMMEDSLEDLAELGIDTNNMEYIWAHDIDAHQLSVLSPIYDSGTAMAIIEEIFGDEDDTPGQGDGNDHGGH